MEWTMIVETAQKVIEGFVMVGIVIGLAGPIVWLMFQFWVSVLGLDKKEDNDKGSK